ncbi:rubrerythrin [Halanaerobacter jeridensis]|uniref:Rubrerythrin n=1 Tax=Halanaerobacter jeridensis TaxID=706427 RepID=A0A939BNM1_9FIRM|nr:rubrerythrin family protein [Halanaerobacter jeridensis]MBM7555727.1 rubrerythrin [Halanaerobacter jeridensis]
MSELKGSNTEENLLMAFALESQARNRYDYFALQARKEGYDQIARIFAETAQNEKEHGKIFFNFLEGGQREIKASYPAGKIGTTKENLKLSIDGEHRENSDLYPKFAEEAEEEGFPKVAKAFRNIAQIEEGHENKYRALLDKVEELDLEPEQESKKKWECVKCGYVHQGEEPPEVCPVCDHAKRHFRPQNRFLSSYYRSEKSDHNKTYYQGKKSEKDCYSGC